MECSKADTLRWKEKQIVVEQEIDVDCKRVVNKSFANSSFDGSENDLVLDTLFHLVGSEMLQFREKLVIEPVPPNLKSLIKF